VHVVVVVLPPFLRAMAFGVARGAIASAAVAAMMTAAITSVFILIAHFLQKRILIRLLGYYKRYLPYRSI
jgi:hypothetical protein